MNLKNGFGLLRGSPSFPPLPDDFIFGVASADHQCEAYKKGWDDIRDEWEPSVGRVVRGNATEFWDRYAADIDLAKKMDCRAFRFSVSWSRVEKDPEIVLQHYEDLVDEIIKAGMQPVLTLHHFVWPPWVDMIADEFPDLFGSYVSKVVERLGDKVKCWVPINEPNNLIGGYVKPFWDGQYGAPPGDLNQSASVDPSVQIETVGKLIPNLFRAYANAYDEIKEQYPTAEVGTNPWVAGFPPWLQWLIDSNAQRMGEQMKSFEDWRNQKTTLIDHKPFDHGRSDIVLATFTKTPRREQEVNFSSEIYFETEQRLLVLADTNHKTIDDLAGKAIVAVKGSTAELSAQRLMGPSRNAITAKSSPAALELLEKGRADAFLSDLSIIHGLIRENPRHYRLIDERLDTEYYAAATTQGNWKLLSLVDQAIWRFKDSGEWAKSYVEHINRSDVPKPPANVHHTQKFKEMAMQEGLSPSEMKDPAFQRILKKGVIRVAVKSDVRGFSEQVGKGEFRGLEIDLAHAIARRIFGDPSKVHFISVDTKDRLSELVTWRGSMDSLTKIYCTISTIFAFSNWWYLGLAGKLPAFICPAECWDELGRPKLDFIGLDYYYGIRSIRPDLIIGLMNAGSNGDFDQAPIWPEALYDHLNNLSKLINDPAVLKGRPPLPLYILENGWVDVKKKPMDRAEYIRSHVLQVQRAYNAGLNVKMYLYWSLTTNNEWGLPIGPNTDFGLYHIDLKKEPGESGYQVRDKTDVCKLYKDIVDNKGVP
jgi:beta-glucosidase/6-phospho-beta-glucosidase/beta-galactosidase/ABC-type amino acid transport substrate-binding protein